MRLKEHERQQSGVKVILGELERRVEELVGKCSVVVDMDLGVDARKTLWFRAQIAAMRGLIDNIRVQGDDVEHNDGDNEFDREG